MTDLYINKIKENPNDFGYDVLLPEVTLVVQNKRHNLLIGQKYKTNDSYPNNRNLYKNKQIVGVLKYKKIELKLEDLNLLFNSKDKKQIKKRDNEYQIYLTDL